MKGKKVFVISHSSVFTLSYHIIRTAVEAAGSIKIENEIKLKQKPSFHSSFHDTVETALSSINSKCFLCAHLFSISFTRSWDCFLLFEQTAQGSVGERLFQRPDEVSSPHFCVSQ